VIGTLLFLGTVGIESHNVVLTFSNGDEVRRMVHFSGAEGLYSLIIEK
jgi:hypothetical protein